MHKKSLKKILLEYNPDTLSVKAAEEPALPGDTPIVAADQMAAQLSVDLPPIEDDSYLPATRQELSAAASIIAKRCPPDQLEFFYRQMLDLVEQAVAKSRETPENVYLEDEEEIKRPIIVQKESKKRVPARLLGYIIDVNKNPIGESMSARNKDFARKWKQGDDLNLSREDIEELGDDLEFHPDAEDLLDFMDANELDDASQIYGATPETAEQANREYSLTDILKSNVFPSAGRESAIHNKIERNMFQPLRMVKSAPQVSDRLTSLIKSPYAVEAFVDSMYHADLLSDESLEELRANPEAVYGSAIFGNFTSIAFVRPTVKELEKLADLGPDVFDFKRQKSQISPEDAKSIINTVKAAWERKNASQKSKIATKAVTQKAEFDARDKSVMG